MIRPFSIALIYGGLQAKEYADKMKRKIIEDTVLYPFNPLLVDGGTGDIWSVIENTFDKADYAIVFLSQVYEYKYNNQKIGSSTPNLLIELGYMLHKLGKDKIVIIADFIYEKIAKKEFLFPSDLNGLFIQNHQDLKDPDTVNFTIARIWDEIKTSLINGRYINTITTAKQLLTNRYIPNMVKVFSKEMEEKIDNYSIDKQYEIVWKTWMSELAEIDMIECPAEIIYKTIFLFERLLLLFMFVDYWLDDNTCIDISNMNFSENDNATESVHQLLYQEIIKYIIYSSRLSSNELFKIGDRIHKYESLCKDNNEFIKVLAEDYAGLCYYNGCRKSSDLNSKKDMLEKASKCFQYVISRSAQFSNNISIDGRILCAYAKYNQARTLQLLGKEYEEFESLFDQSISDRHLLSQCSYFPEFVKLYWKREEYLAENAKIDACFMFWKNDKRIEAKRKLNDILFDLRKSETTIVAGQEFFKKLKAKTEDNILQIEKGE